MPRKHITWKTIAPNVWPALRGEEDVFEVWESNLGFYLVGRWHVGAQFRLRLWALVTPEPELRELVTQYDFPFELDGGTCAPIVWANEQLRPAWVQQAR